MGYSTNFIGHFNLDKQLTLDDYRYLIEFYMKDHREEKYCPKYGYYCQWKPTEDGRGIEWSGGEKFTAYTEWLQYLIDNFFIPKKYKITGGISYQGEDTGDCGTIEIKKNKVIKIKYKPQNSSIEELVKKGLKECDSSEDAYWYLEQIAKKLKIKI